MRVLNITALAIIFAVVRSTTSTASGQRWAARPYQTPGGYPRPAMRPNVHVPHVHKRPHSGMTSTMWGQHSSSPVATETMTVFRPEHHQPMMTEAGAEDTIPLAMTGDMIEDISMGGAQEPNLHKPHSGMTSTMVGQHSMPEHHHQNRPMMTQKPISETAPLSGEADTEESTMPQAMSEDMIEDNTMAGQELINDPESDEAMIEEMSEHEEMISLHEFKEVLHELVKAAVNKIVKKKAGFLESIKTAKQNQRQIDSIAFDF